MTVRMERLFLRRAGGEMEFRPHSADGLYILDHEGLGLPDPQLRLHVSESRDGAVFSGHRAQVRQVMLALGLRAGDRRGLEQKRERLQTMLGLGQEVTLAVVRADGTERAITAIRAGGDDMAFRTINRTGNHERVAVRLVCPNPYFAAPAGLMVNLSGQAIQAGSRVPMHVPTRVGGAAWGSNRVVVNTGSIPARPVIRMSGSLEGVRIVNATNGRSVAFNAGYRIPDGTTIVFDTDTTEAYDEATRASVASRLDTDSNIGDFRLEPGNNLVTVQTNRINSGSRVILEFTPMYLSGV